jgi:hypothetical protein
MKIIIAKTTLRWLETDLWIYPGKGCSENPESLLTNPLKPNSLNFKTLSRSRPGLPRLSYRGQTFFRRPGNWQKWVRCAI